MTAFALSLTLGLLWLNLIGLGLAARRVTGDYAVARVAGVLAPCALLFFLEHFAGLGPSPWGLLPASAASAWLVWRDRLILRENWLAEAFFLLGFAYCFAWRWFFPDIDTVAEKIPDLVFIQDYSTGGKLPATDRWLPPFNASFYYGLQHYSAGLLARVMGVAATVSYQLSYCVLTGLTTCAAGMAAVRMGAGKLGSWLAPVTLLIGGNGVIVALPILLKDTPELWKSSRFLGIHMPREEWTELGKIVEPAVNPGAGERVQELPMDTLSYAIHYGEYHAPLLGFMLLAFTCLLIASLEAGAEGRSRHMLHALLGGTIPLALIGNVWIAPLQILVVGSWALYRALRREWNHWPALAGGCAFFLVLAYPHLVEFTTQSISGHSSLKLTPPEFRSGWGPWLLMFWPVAGILLLGFANRERRWFNAYLLNLWAVLLLFTEFFYNDDGFANTWERYNSTLKWWPWVFAGIVITVGSSNLASSSRLCRWGTGVLLLLTCTFAKVLFSPWAEREPSSVERFSGTSWLLKSPELKALHGALSARPDGVALESGHISGNNETGVVSIFANKACHVGWSVHEEVLWRGVTSQVGTRVRETAAFYAGKLPDPARWLAHNDIRYVLWLERDNRDHAAGFAALRSQLAGLYQWHGFPVAGQDREIGFWERIVGPSVGR